jgi:hypothetical protein
VRQVQAVALQTISSDFSPAPPVLAVPAHPQGGQSWNFTLVSTDGKVRIDTTNRIETPNEPVTLGQGAMVNTVKIFSTGHVTGTSTQGSLDLTINRTTWYARDQHLEVKEVTDTSGRVGLCTVDFHVESLGRSA